LHSGFLRQSLPQASSPPTPLVPFKKDHLAPLLSFAEPRNRDATHVSLTGVVVGGVDASVDSYSVVDTEAVDSYSVVDDASVVDTEAEVDDASVVVDASQSGFAQSSGIDRKVREFLSPGNVISFVKQG